MRINCKQCGKNIHSEQCSKYCDYNKRQKQVEDVQKECNDLFEKAFPQFKGTKDSLNKL